MPRIVRLQLEIIIILAEKTNRGAEQKGDSTWKRVAAEPLSSSCPLSFFTFKGEKKWQIYEASSGILVHETSRKPSKSDVDEFLGKQGIKKIASAVDRSIQKTDGFSPKYGQKERHITQKGVEYQLLYEDASYSNLDITGYLKEIEMFLPNEGVSICEQIDNEVEALGYISTQFPNINKKYCFIKSVDVKYKPRIELYCFKTGKIIDVRIMQKVFNKQKLKKGDVVYADVFSKEPKWRILPDGKFEKIKGEFEWHLSEYSIVDLEEFNVIVNKSFDKKLTNMV